MGALALFWAVITLAAAAIRTTSWAISIERRGLTVWCGLATAGLLAIYVNGLAPLVHIKGPPLSPLGTGLLLLLPGVAALGAGVATLREMLRR